MSARDFCCSSLSASRLDVEGVGSSTATGDEKRHTIDLEFWVASRRDDEPACRTRALYLCPSCPFLLPQSPCAPPPLSHPPRLTQPPCLIPSALAPQSQPPCPATPVPPPCLSPLAPSPLPHPCPTHCLWQYNGQPPGKAVLAVAHPEAAPKSHMHASRCHLE